MKRPILGLLAAAILSLGLLGSSPVQAAMSSPTAATVDHPYDDDDDDDDGDGHHKRRCSGLIVLFCS